MVLDRGVAAFILKPRRRRATPFETLAFCPRTRVRKAPAAGGRCLESAPALAKIWNGSRYLRVLGDAVKRALKSARSRAAINHPHRGQNINARSHLHWRRRTHRGPLSPGAAEKRPDRHRASSPSAIRGHDEPPDHLSALLRLRAPKLFRLALQLPRRGA